jgi:hypothetical protein
MDIDKTGSDRQIGGVNDPIGRSRTEIVQYDNFPVTDTKIAWHRWIAETIEQVAVTDNNVESVARSAAEH